MDKMLDKCIKAAKAFVQRQDEDQEYLGMAAEDIIVFENDSYQFVKIIIKNNSKSFDLLPDNLREEMEQAMILWFAEHADDINPDVPISLDVITFNILAEDRAIIRYQHNLG